MESDVSKTHVNDETILNIKEIFKLIDKLEYEEAFLLSSKIIERNDNGDQLFHEWIKALAESYSCNSKETAIQLLTKVKPDELENEIHFRIINSLMCFYIEIGNEQKFLEHKDKLISNLDKLDNDELLTIIMCNIANGYYEFKNHKISLEYCEKAISMCQQYRIFSLNFSVVVMIKIVDLFYLREIEKAKKLEKDFETFLRLTNNIDDLKYLKENLEEFYKEVQYDKKSI